ncbi:PTS system mannose-specific IIC component [Entomoplasma freundtii]|uniref:PTS fructose transporter subunit IIBC n=1 Tax=Entomoplasma freundtii TaxID=74700 RepID=A0A2K8NQJ8_9MOLU|nr:PTS fructose transporter subunit IIBC [Entomoplasma freundtii]ATZ16057.1 PTS fructose transporter subunit IIBC [Entomoplasma freundtii]TDY58074.1 PTS system mannose-specific IIC component [Entomoplasma freundtii]
MDNDQLQNLPTSSTPEPQTQSLKIVAITACAAGVAHTYMAAEQLTKTAEKLSHKIHVETQGTIGAENIIPENILREADLVIIAADVKIDLSRFQGKKTFQCGVNDAIKDPANLLVEAWDKGTPYGKKGTKVGNVTFGTTKRKGMLSHMMTGISWILPLTIAAGILMAIANLCAFQTEYLDSVGDYTENWVLGERPFPQFLMDVGGLGFKLMIPLFAGFIAYSMADKPGLAPGIIGGWIINDNKMLGISVPVAPNAVIEPGAGFLGAIIIGILTGWTVQILKIIRWPRILLPVVPLMIIPIVATFAIATFTKFVIGPPIANLVLGMFDGLVSLEKQFAGTGYVLALVISLMVAFDLGGPFNKTALVFGTVIFYQTLATALANGGGYWDANFIPGTAAQAAISVPPLGMWLSTIIFKNRYTKNERVMGKAALGTGIMGITEGAIPFAAADPFRVIFANCCGAAVAGLGVTLFNVKFAAGLGSPLGTFLGYIQQNSAPFWPMAWILPIVLGIVVTATIAGLLKKKVVGEEAELLKTEQQTRADRRHSLWLDTKTFFKQPKVILQKIHHFFITYFRNHWQSTKEYWTWIGKSIAKYFVDKWQGWKKFGQNCHKLVTTKPKMLTFKKKKAQKVEVE